MDALAVMAVVDQFILFFFAMKVCLTLSTKLNEILFEDEIRLAGQ